MMVMGHHRCTGAWPDPVNGCPASNLQTVVGCPNTETWRRGFGSSPCRCQWTVMVFLRRSRTAAVPSGGARGSGRTRREMVTAFIMAGSGRKCPPPSWCLRRPSPVRSICCPEVANGRHRQRWMVRGRPAGRANSPDRWLARTVAVGAARFQPSHENIECPGVLMVSKSPRRDLALTNRPHDALESHDCVTIRQQRFAAFIPRRRHRDGMSAVPAKGSG